MATILEIPGIGEKTAKLFNRLGIFSVSDLAEFYPRDYKDRTNIMKISELGGLKKGEPATLLCRISKKPENVRIKNLIMTKAKIADETGAIEAVWFNMPYLKTQLKEGESYFFVGTPKGRFGRITITNPEFELFSEGESLSYSRIVPVYKSTRGLTQKSIRKAVHAALSDERLEINDFLPERIKSENGLCDRKHAVNNIHFPVSNKEFLNARKRLCFDEFFVLQAALYKFKNRRVKEVKGFVLSDMLDYCEITKGFPFEFTAAQKKALAEIKSDMLSGFAMNRLIQGDVGSGKTAVATVAAYWTIQNGYQCALMAPTEVLASQHYNTISELFEKHGVHTVLLKGSTTKKQRTETLSEIASGKAKMIIGTHAVIQKSVIFNRLGLVITDEQHRFGVRQRGALQDKGESPHVIVMTATPIPRTLALILYGDLDISIINELPPGRTEIDTRAAGEELRPRVYSFIEKQIEEGRQAYIICPAIEKQEDGEETVKSELLYVNEHIKELKEKVFAGHRVASLHGKMKPFEKDEIMEAFASGKIDILVSTTVIEVGINVPNATVMVVENAERFGLSQLHQLRGRVGRGVHKSYCILISNSDGEVARERLNVMKSTTDGFVISEMDLKLRGSGDFFGTRQHGLPEMKIANLFKDMEILKMAQKSAEELTALDPRLESLENKGISETIDKMFADARFGVNL